MREFCIFALAAAVSFAPLSALAWGDKGHHIVCELAYEQVKPATKKAIDDLIAEDPEFHSFSDSCSWPDHPRKRASEHYINLPRSQKTVASATCPGGNPCLFTAIAQDEAILASSTADDAQKLVALKYLGHWIGDIHQPLHVSFADDRGGNEIVALGPCTSTNLHAVWDTCIVESEFPGSAKDAASKLLATISEEERAAWTSSGPAEWANESFQIARRPDLQYCFEKLGKCRYSATRIKWVKGVPKRKVNVDQAYIDDHVSVVNLQLQKASVRLARDLDEALGGNGTQ